NHFKPSHWSEDQRILNKGDHEPIVSVEEYERAQTMLKRRANNEMSKNSYMYAYSGILQCGECGGNFNGNGKKVKKADGTEKVHKGYRCHNNYLYKTCNTPSISETQLNRLVFDHVMIVGHTV